MHFALRTGYPISKNYKYKKILILGFRGSSLFLWRFYSVVFNAYLAFPNLITRILIMNRKNYCNLTLFKILINILTYRRNFANGWWCPRRVQPVQCPLYVTENGPFIDVRAEWITHQTFVEAQTADSGISKDRQCLDHFRHV